MKLSYKYRIYPNKSQAEVLEKNFQFCNYLYNFALEERNSYYKTYNKSLSYVKQAAGLKDLKETFAEQTSSIYSQTLQQVLKRLDRSYQNFFRRIKQGASKAGFPRFKSIFRSQSVVFPQSDLTKGGVKLLLNNKLKIFGIPGEITIKWHRPFEGRCKQVIIKRQSGKYYLILSCDEVPKELLPSTGKTTAIDLGIDNFITTDDGITFHHPKPYKTAKEKLAYLNRKLAAKQQDSNNRRKDKSALAKAYDKITNIRQDFQHKVAKQLVNENDVIIVEKLNIQNMLEAKGFEVSKSNITDASWGNFISMLKYKAERAGRIIIEVDPRNTSKTCSNCGNIKTKLLLKDREYCCEACGFKMDRDQNAAINIRRLGTSLATTQIVSEAMDFSPQ